jgi:two-component system cell cycle response regulator DivK
MQRGSILVVDDDEDGREMLVHFLFFRGFQVAAARDGMEAVDVARRIQPRIVLMDLSLPIVNGWDATRQLRTDPLTKDIIILAVTAHAFPPEQQSARAAGCDAIIAKPLDLDLLVVGLNQIMSDGLSGFDAYRMTAR